MIWMILKKGIKTKKLTNILIHGMFYVDFYVILQEGRIIIGRDTTTTVGVLKFGSSVNTLEPKGECKVSLNNLNNIFFYTLTIL